MAAKKQVKSDAQRWAEKKTRRAIRGTKPTTVGTVGSVRDIGRQTLLNRLLKHLATAETDLAKATSEHKLKSKGLVATDAKTFKAFIATFRARGKEVLKMSDDEIRSLIYKDNRYGAYCHLGMPEIPAMSEMDKDAIVQGQGRVDAIKARINHIHELPHVMFRFKDEATLELFVQGLRY